MAVDFKALARLGAEARFAELIAEVDAILAAFPDLGQAAARPATEAETKPVRKRRRRRPKMTPEQRKAVGLRMKRYWAARRKAKKA